MTNEQLENEIAEIIKGFRKGTLERALNQEHVHRWVIQFDADVSIVLNETLHILKEWYLSEDKIRSFLREVIDHLQKENENGVEKNPLNGIHIFDIQERGQSQSQLVQLLKEEMGQKHQCNVESEKLKGEKYYLYLDDGLYTGRTLGNV